MSGPEKDDGLEAVRVMARRDERWSLSDWSQMLTPEAAVEYRAERARVRALADEARREWEEGR